MTDDILTTSDLLALMIRGSSIFDAYFDEVVVLWDWIWSGFSDALALAMLLTLEEQIDLILFSQFHFKISTWPTERSPKLRKLAPVR